MKFTGKDRERGIKARQLLENDLLNECFDLLIDSTIKQWQSETDPEVRERLWYIVKGTENARELLKGFIGIGSAAEKQIAKQAKK